ASGQCAGSPRRSHGRSSGGSRGIEALRKALFRGRAAGALPPAISGLQGSRADRVRREAAANCQRKGLASRDPAAKAKGMSITISQSRELNQRTAPSAHVDRQRLNAADRALLAV